MAIASVNEWRLPESVRSDLGDWFAQRAEAVDRVDVPAQEALRHWADRGLLAKGVPQSLGGDGGSIEEMAEVIAVIAGSCLTSAFVLWSHRIFLAYGAASDNAYLIDTVMPQVLRGEIFGATGLANAMKYAVSMEALRLRAQAGGGDGDYVLSGDIPWASNLVTGKFIVVVAAGMEEQRVLLAAVPATSPGLIRGDIHSLVGLTGSQSGSLSFERVRVPAEGIISGEGRAFMARIRPTFLVLQTALAWGVAEAALAYALPRATGPKSDLQDEGDRLKQALDRYVADVRTLSRKETWDGNSVYRALQIRKDLVTLVVDAVSFEMEVAGGTGYVAGSSTARRWRECAFFPVLSPSPVQLRLEMQRLENEAGVQVARPS